MVDRGPVTLFAVRGMRESGSNALNATFRRVAQWFSNLIVYEWVPVASGTSADMAYTVSLERYTATVVDGPETAVYRSTHVFRREDGHWRAIHRHADRAPVEGFHTRGSIVDRVPMDVLVPAVSGVSEGSTTSDASRSTPMSVGLVTCIFTT